MVGWSDGEELGLALAGLGGRKRARQYTGQHAGLIGWHGAGIGAWLQWHVLRL